MAGAFDPAVSEARAEQAIDEAVARMARGEGRTDRMLVIFGANWCHDSLALAGWLLDPRFGEQVRPFDLHFIDVGHPQDGRGRNLALARRFGLDHLASTPALVVLDGKGRRLNSVADALAWRDAASRDPFSIRAALAGYRKAAPAD